MLWSSSRIRSLWTKHLIKTNSKQTWSLQKKATTCASQQPSLKMKISISSPSSSRHINKSHMQQRTCPTPPSRAPNSKISISVTTETASLPKILTNFKTMLKKTCLLLRFNKIRSKISILEEVYQPNKRSSSHVLLIIIIKRTWYSHEDLPESHQEHLLGKHLNQMLKTISKETACSHRIRSRCLVARLRRRTIMDRMKTSMMMKESWMMKQKAEAMSWKMGTNRKPTIWMQAWARMTRQGSVH